MNGVQERKHPLTVHLSALSGFQRCVLPPNRRGMHQCIAVLSSFALVEGVPGALLILPDRSTKISAAAPPASPSRSCNMAHLGTRSKKLTPSTDVSVACGSALNKGLPRGHFDVLSTTPQQRSLVAHHRAFGELQVCRPRQSSLSSNCGRATPHPTQKRWPPLATRGLLHGRRGHIAGSVTARRVAIAPGASSASQVSLNAVDSSGRVGGKRQERCHGTVFQVLNVVCCCQGWVLSANHAQAIGNRTRHYSMGISSRGERPPFSLNN